MNSLEKKLIAILEELKANYEVVMVKAEFETEASRMNELMRLKEIAEHAGVGLNMKIGGPEALSNMYEAMHLGVAGLVAPMVETPYSARKFFAAVREHIDPEELKGIEIGVNIETITAHNNFDAILKEKDARIMNNVVVGRVDLSRSMDLTTQDINSPKVYEVCESVLKKGKAHGKRCCVGGGISGDAVDFLMRLSSSGILDRYETRKVVFQNVKADKKAMIEGIRNAVEFEYNWLLLKKQHYTQISTEDDARIEMLKKRLSIEASNIEAAKK